MCVANASEYTVERRDAPLTEVIPPLQDTDGARARMVAPPKVKDSTWPAVDPAGSHRPPIVSGGRVHVQRLVAEGGFEPPTKGL